MQYLFSFVFVIGLLLAMLWTLRRLQNGQGWMRKTAQRLQTLEMMSVGTRQKIMLIRVDDREILVGISVHSMTVLSPWPQNDTDKALHSDLAHIEALTETPTP
jgi:flagellar protein FliO/FliZ